MKKVFLSSVHIGCKSFFLEKLCGVLQKQPSGHHPIKKLLCIFQRNAFLYFLNFISKAAGLNYPRGHMTWF